MYTHPELSAVVQELRAMKLKEATKKVENNIEETLTYCNFSSEHWTRIRTNTVIERLNWEICRIQPESANNLHIILDSTGAAELGRWAFNAQSPHFPRKQWEVGAFEWIPLGVQTAATARTGAPEKPCRRIGKAIR